MDLFTTTTATTTTTTTTTPSPFTTTTTAVVAAVADMYNYYNYTTTTTTTTTAATITATTNIFTTLLNESSFFSNGTSLLPFNDNNTTNTTNNNHDHNHHLADVFTTPLYALVWVSLTNFLVLVTGVVGNVLVIAVVALVRDMRSPTNLCLVNLSLADLLVLLICQPSAMLEFYEEEKWMLGSFMCKLTLYLENVVCLASILIIICISFERYTAVSDPIKNQQANSSYKKAMIKMMAMWVIAAAVTSPMLVIAKTRSVMHLVDRVEVTVCTGDVATGWALAYVVGQFIFVFVVPLCLLIFLYYKIYRAISKMNEAQRGLNQADRDRREESRRSVIVMLVMMVVLFFVCLLPFRIAALCWIFGSCFVEPAARLNLLHLFRLLVYINSAGNPIIYSLVSTKFRNAFSKVLRGLSCRCCLGKQGGAQQNSNSSSRSSRGASSSIKHSTNTYYSRVSKDDESPTSTDRLIQLASNVSWMSLSVCQTYQLESLEQSPTRTIGLPTFCEAAC